jgi:hypothetical protein
MSVKRAKTDESSSDTSPCESSTSMIQEGDKQLGEISAKLSLILTAIQDLTDAVRHNMQQFDFAKTKNAVVNIKEVMEGIDETARNIPNQFYAEDTNMKENVDYFESEAMRIKANMNAIWEKKLNQRKYAFWGNVRNGGTLIFYERWLESTPIIIPRKFQKSEFNNEKDEQRMLRERAVIHDFKLEIEMMRLREASCIETYRRIDKEMEDIIMSKCSGKTAECLLNMWKQNILRNEEISLKRWKNNEKWLTAYEEEFRKTFENINPFFKKESRISEIKRERPMSYAEAVKRRPFNGRARSKSRNSNQRNSENLKELVQEFITKLNRNEMQQNKRSFGQQQNRRSFGQQQNKRSFGQQQNRRMNFHQQRNNYNQQQQKAWRNKSNNSKLSQDDVVRPEDFCSFLEADHNWTCEM